MIILKEKVAGYNNTLILATKEMKFGIKEEVNKAPNENSKITTTIMQDLPMNSTTHETEGTTYLLASAITLGFVFAKYVI